MDSAKLAGQYAARIIMGIAIAATLLGIGYSYYLFFNKYPVGAGIFTACVIALALLKRPSQ